MTNYGYLIKKADFNEDFLTNIKDDLTVKPVLNNKYNIKEDEPFPIYQEGNSKILLPKFYGLEVLGKPNEIKTSKETADKINITETSINRIMSIGYTHKI
jgi:hypothetical protein